MSSELESWADRPDAEFSLLTFNTHLFEGSNAVTGAVLADFFNDTLKPLVYRDEERLEELIARIAALSPVPDVICLQEVWAPKMQSIAAARLLEVLDVSGDPDEHVFVPPYRGKVLPTRGDELVADVLETAVRNEIMHADDWKAFQRRLLGSYTNSSGLMVVSRHPLRARNLVRYKGASKQEDQLAEKGGLVFTVDVPAAEEVRPVRFGMTHAFTPHAEALANIEQLADLVQQTAGDGDAIILGDFNIHAHRVGNDCARSEYEGLRTALCVERGAVDVIAEHAPVGWTDWPQGNRFSQVLKAQTAAWQEAERRYKPPPALTKMKLDPFGAVKVPDYKGWLERKQKWRKEMHKRAAPLQEVGIAEVLSPSFAPLEEGRDLIDYVFLLPGRNRSLSAPSVRTTVRIHHDWRLDGGEGADVSDHAPVLVTFHFGQ